MAQNIFVPYAVSGGGGGGSNQAIESLAGQWAVPAGVLIGQIVYPTGSFSADLGDASGLLTCPAIGVVIAKTSPTQATLLYKGQSPSIFAGLVPSKEYFLSASAPGGVSLTPPSPDVTGSIVQRVGVAASSAIMLFDPDPTKVIF